MSRVTVPARAKGFRPSNLAALSSFKHRNYTLFFLGQVISVAGTWMQTVAQSYLVLKITGSGVDLGLVLAIKNIPVMLFSTVGGIITDRVQRINLLYFTNAANLILSSVLAWDVLAGHPTIFFIYAIALGLGIVNAIDNPARQVIISDLVPRGELNNAVSLNSVQTNGGRILGPAIAGGIIAFFGLGTCFALNAASYIVVIGSLLLMRRSQFQNVTKAAPEKGQIRAGFRYVRSQADLYLPLILLFIVGLLVWEFAVSIPLIASRTFHGGPAVYGYLFSLQGLGAVIGGLVVASRPAATNRGLTWTAIGCGIACILAGVAPTITTEYVVMVAVGYTVVAFNSIAKSQLQLRSSSEMRGRVMSIWTLCWVGTTPIGGPLLGLIADHLGARWVWYLSGAPLLIAGIAVLPAMVRLDNATPSESHERSHELLDEVRPATAPPISS
jgi:MFS family permease